MKMKEIVIMQLSNGSRPLVDTLDPVSAIQKAGILETLEIFMQRLSQLQNGNIFRD